MNINYQDVKYENLSIPFENMKETLKKNLQEYGVASVSGVLMKEEIDRSIQLGKDYLSNVFEDDVHNVKMDDPSSWKNIGKKMYAKHGGLIQHFGIGQSDFVWSARDRPNVKSVFSEIWGTNDLITSFDAGNATPPPEITNSGWQRSGNFWWHHDQGKLKKDFCSVQGIVNLEKVEKGDATLAVIRGSHHFHQQFFEKFGLDGKDDWQKLDIQHVEWFLQQEYAPGKKCDIVAVSANAGDMILWDSRTVHMGISPSPSRKQHDRWRWVVYVAMFPRSQLSKKDIENRKLYAIAGRTTTHYGKKLFPCNPNTYGNPIYKMKKPTLILKDLKKKTASEISAMLKAIRTEQQLKLI